MKEYFKWILWTLLGVGLLLIPKIFGIYYTNFFVGFAIMAIFSQSLNLELGYAHLLNFGHAMFFGIGGYGTAMVLTHVPGMPLLGAFVVGVLAAAFLALLLCPLIVRVSGMAFAMLHVAFCMLLFMLALKLRAFTGGEDGIGGFPLPAFSIPGIISLNMKDPLKFYYFAIAILFLSMWLMWFFTKTPFGQVMLGIRDNPDRMDYLGFKVPQSKGLIYIVGGLFAGVAGSIYALFQNLISPDAINIVTSFMPVLMVMMGGLGTFAGPILGAGIYQVVEEIARHYTESG